MFIPTLPHIKHLSSSSLLLYMRSREEWWKRYVDGIKEEPSEAMKIGTAIHAEIAQFIETNKEPESPSLSFTYWREWAIENGFDFASFIEFQCKGMIDDIPITGFIDALEPDCIYDWKTTKTFHDNWHMSYEVQGVTYSILVDCPHVQFVELKKTKARKSGFNTYNVEITEQKKEAVRNLYRNMVRELNGEEVDPVWKDEYYVREAMGIDLISL